MSLNNTLQQNDIGITLQVTAVLSDGQTPQNISGVNNPNVFIYRPDGYTIVSSGSLTANNGTDGIIQYTTKVNDLAVCGLYGIRAQYYRGTNIFYTDRGIFVVEPNP